MKKIIKFLCVLFLSLALFYCSKEDSIEQKAVTDGDTIVNNDNYSSITALFSENEIPLKVSTFDYATGCTFTTTQGSVVTIPANAFFSLNGTNVSGELTVEFRDVYTKSDMIFNSLSTNTRNGGILKSGGMFYLRVLKGNEALQLIPGINITVDQPFKELALDQNMQAFKFKNDSAIVGWIAAKADTTQMRDSLSWTPSGYVYSFYEFKAPLSSGSWCNSDNSSFFSIYTQTKLTVKPQEDYDAYDVQVYLLFTGVNSMIHVYKNWNSTEDEYPYNYAPVGLSCTVVCVGVHEGKIYASFNPITITSNMNMNFSLTKMTKDAFKEKLQALN